LNCYIRCICCFLFVMLGVDVVFIMLYCVLMALIQNFYCKCFFLNNKSYIDEFLSNY